MAAERETLVAGKHDDRIVGRWQGIENAAELGIEICNHRVGDRQFLTHCGFSTRAGQQPLVTPVDVAMIEGMLAGEIRRKRNFCRVIPISHSRGPLTRVVGKREIHMQYPRLASWNCLK